MKKASRLGWLFLMLAEWTVLEPATPGVTGRYSNQLNYHSKLLDYAPYETWCKIKGPRFLQAPDLDWRPQRDSNSCYRRERAVS